MTFLNFLARCGKSDCFFSFYLIGGGNGGVLGLGVLGGKSTGSPVPGGGGKSIGSPVPGGGGVNGETSPRGASTSSDFLSGVNGEMSPLKPGPGDDASVSCSEKI